MAKSIKNGFKQETIARITSALADLVRDYEQAARDGKCVPISISTGNEKIGKVMNVSLAPILTCGNACKLCKNLCYDVKACLQYENVRKARARNTVLAIHYRKKYFDQIIKRIQRRKKNFFFRWHVAGDILDLDYFENMIAIARMFPEWTFWTYTKQYHIVNKWIDENGQLPDNLHIMFSQWKIKLDNGQIIAVPLPNPHNLPIFTVVFEEEEFPADYFHCPGNCDVCKENHLGCIAGMNTANGAH